jgi:hypothetical protein
MAEQEIEGHLWDQCVGLDLLRPSARIGCTSLCRTSLQNLGRSDQRSPKLARDKAMTSIAFMQVDPCIKKDVLCKI